MPYRIDISHPPENALDQLVQLGALDIEPINGGIAAIVPDRVTPDAIACALGVASVTVSAIVVRDEGSVWLLSPRAVRIGNLVIAAPGVAAPAGALTLSDSPIFGSGHHSTTVLCVEALEETLGSTVTDSVLDIGTGSGVLALAALTMGVPRAVGIDIDADALRIAAENARLNNLSDRLQLTLGGPDVVKGVWPLVIANVLAAPLMEMAPALVRRVGNRGRLILSGIPWSLESDVRQIYERLGMHYLRSETRAGWTLVVLTSSW